MSSLYNIFDKGTDSQWTFLQEPQLLMGWGRSNLSHGLSSLRRYEWVHSTLLRDHLDDRRR